MFWFLVRIHCCIDFKRKEGHSLFRSVQVFILESRPSSFHFNNGSEMARFDFSVNSSLILYFAQGTTYNGFYESNTAISGLLVVHENISLSDRQRSTRGVDLGRWVSREQVLD